MSARELWERWLRPIGVYRLGTHAVVALALAFSTAGMVGCSGGHSCSPPGGGRCAGPEPIGSGRLTQSVDGMSLSGRFLCGGRLKVAERASEVVVTYVASAVGPGAMSCALVPLRVSLHKPLGQRSVIDGTTHKAIAIGRS